jgi:hypothetical protein
MDQRSVARQKGFMLYMVIAIAALSVALLVVWNLYRSKSAEFESFKVAVKVAGDAQNEKTKLENARLQKERDNADKSLTTARADLKRLRGANSGSRTLSGSAAATGSTGPACYDRPELDRAYGVLVQELRGVADQGAACQVELGNAREWAKALKP